MGVSRHMGKIPRMEESLGKPPATGTRLDMRWCVAAFVTPYAIMDGVAPSAASAPKNKKQNGSDLSFLLS